MAGAEAEFRLRFERAMQARHLVKGHNLNIINPKEIMLHKIIGEGSFGRVWSGRWRSSRVSPKGVGGGLGCRGGAGWGAGRQGGVGVGERVGVGGVRMSCIALVGGEG